MRREVSIDYHPTEKQLTAWEILEDKETNELFYGGAAGGGKSHLGCVWLITNCLRYPSSRWLMARAILKDLKDSTLLTFFQICSEWGLERDKDYKYNSIEGVITFLHTGSAIYLKDLFAYPSDPEFNSLGSREYTGMFIDEGSQITVKAYNIAKSRIRYKLDEFGLIPKVLIASNPSKNFLYYDFYKPYRGGTLEKHKKFLPALVTDNPHISPHYIENLKRLDKISRERLLHGNFEYDDDEARLFDYDKLLEMFGKYYEGGKNRYLTIDVARFGSDKTVIVYWVENYIRAILTYSKQDLRSTRKIIEKLMLTKGIEPQNVIIDEDGVGGGLVDEMRSVKGFVNNARPLEVKAHQNPKGALTFAPKHNYANLKSQCYFLLANKVAKGEIGINGEIDGKIKELIIEDLEQIKQKDIDKDGKLAIVPKEEIKENLGRSTDYGDAIMMRMWFDLIPQYKPYISL